MAAPTATVRQTPGGIKLKDGYQTLITFKRNPTVKFWEKTVTPPGIDGGDTIDTTTMHNADWRTNAARSLVTLTESKCTAAYDPALYNDILALLNINDEITVRFSDGSTLAYWGYLRMFEPSEVSEGEQPEADITIQPTNQDNSGVEQSPVLTSVTGT